MTSLVNSTLKILIPRLLKHFQKTEEKETLPNLFYEFSNTVKPKPDKDDTRKESYRSKFSRILKGLYTKTK